jgi:acyl-CoA thioester hydrolase
MHVGQYRVRYRDVYSAGIVLNSKFLDMCDEAFTEFFRALGFPPHALYAVPYNGALAHMDATFHASAAIDDVLDFDVTCDRIGNSSVILTYTITRSSEPIFTGTARYVNIDDDGNPIPVPDALRAALEAN